MPAKAKTSAKKAKDPCAELKRKLKERDAELKKRDAELKRRNAQLKKRDAELKACYAELMDRDAELKELHEQQTATADILRVISRSSTDIQPVLKAVAESAGRLCEANDVGIRLVDGDVTRIAAHFGPVHFEDSPRPLGSRSVVSRVIRERRTIHVHDVSDPRHLEEYPEAVNAALRAYRTILAVPLVREDIAIGAIVIRRQEMRPFSDKHVKLIETFAAQAVIAIENARLFNELQARNAQLTQSLEQQTATSEILSVISKSPTDVAPVFETIMRNAQNLCGSQFASVFRFDGELVHVAGTHNWPREALSEFLPRFPSPPNPALITGRVILSKSVVRVSDALTEPGYDHARAVRGGWRRVLGVPLLRAGEPIGSINLSWPDPGETPDYQVELLKTFASQAVIAIENVRLFKETKEALERQTATTEILRAIASSPSDVQPVFDTISRNALQLCGSLYAIVHRFDGEQLHLASSHHVASEQAAMLARGYPRAPDQSRAAGRVILSRSVVRIEDALADPDYESPATASAGWRRILGVPMLRDGHPVGAILVGWAEPGPIPKAQEDLLKTFADQAVIAIENVRLFKELQARNAELTESLEQQTVTSEILRIISSSPTDTQPVFDAIVNSGVQLFGGMNMALRLVKGDYIERVNRDVGR